MTLTSWRWVFYFLLPLLFMSSAWFLPAIGVTLYATADTTLYQNAPDDNLGAIDTFIVGTTAGAQSNRALIRFDPSAVLPPQAIIQSVTLTLNVMKTTATETHLFRLYRIRRDWNEGVGADVRIGLPAQEGETTWNARLHPDQLWSQPGAQATNDYAGTVSAETMILAEGAYDFVSSNLVADVNFWRTNGAGNFGWIVICANEAVVPSSRRFAAREDAVFAPQLKIEYELPARQSLVLMPEADTALFEYHPDFNLGACELATGSIGLNTNRTRTLMKFDLSVLPTDAVLLAASLRINVTRSGQGPGSNFLLHQLRKSWGEGEGIGLDGSPAFEGEANWMHRFYPDTPWSAPGAEAGSDYAPGASATTYVGYTGPWTFSNVLADVNFWRDNPGTNFGWIMISDAEDVSRTARRIASRESPDEGPRLLIEYVEPPLIEHVQLSNGKLGFSFGALAYNRYCIECKAALDGGSWHVCTNLPLLQVSGPVTVELPVSGPQQFYRVNLQP